MSSLVNITFCYVATFIFLSKCITSNQPLAMKGSSDQFFLFFCMLQWRSLNSGIIVLYLLSKMCCTLLQQQLCVPNDRNCMSVKFNCCMVIGDGSFGDWPHQQVSVNWNQF